MRQRSIVAVLFMLGIVSGMLAPAAGAIADKPVQHCVLVVTGQDQETKELITEPMTCTTGDAPQVRTSYSAVHFTGSNFTGSTLSIIGNTCSGGWLNMPTGWANVISSTSSACFVSHYDLYYLAGDSESTFNPGGNLFFLDNRTNSASYG
jgi:hypothetical protein